MPNLQDGSKALERISKALDRPTGLAEAFAAAVFAEAQRRAQSKPTPQARMAAEVMGIRGDEITVLAGGTPGAEVSGGSEWGSDIYRQFAPRNEGGYWLFPAGESEAAEVAGDRYLEEMMQRAIRSRGLSG